MKVSRVYIFATMACLLSLFICGVGSAQEWVARYNGPVNGHDHAFSLALDDSGYIYVTGYSRGILGNDEVATIKYSPTGVTIWVNRYNSSFDSSSYARALKVDDSGFVYVTGSIYSGGGESDYLTIKYSPAGSVVWTTGYSATVFDEYSGNALAIDDNGSVYVTGWPVTIKYSPSGDTLWQRPGGIGGLIALDDSGHVYVTSKVDDYNTVKYSPSGDTIWVRYYDGPGGTDQVTSLAIDDAGNAYVTGFSEGVVSGFDFATIKYAPNGDTLWVRRYNGPDNLSDGATSLRVDSNGNVYVAGSSTGIGSGPDFTTVKYSPAGTMLWVRRYDGMAHLSDGATDLTVDNSGNVYVTGTCQQNRKHVDFATLSYSSNGELQSVRLYDGPSNSTGFQVQRPRAIAADGSGNVYVTGESVGVSSGWDYTTIKYSPLGTSGGDVTCDGVFDLTDVVLLGSVLDGLIILSDSCGEAQSDVDGDGDVDEDDFTLLFDIVAGVGL